MSVLRAAALLLLPACSFAFVQRPAAEPVQVYVSCTDTKLAPVSDVGIAVASLATIVLASATAAMFGALGSSRGRVELAEYAGAALIVPIVAVVSATYGYRQVRRCRASHAATLDWAGRTAPASAAPAR